MAFSGKLDIEPNLGMSLRSPDGFPGLKQSPACLGAATPPKLALSEAEWEQRLAATFLS